MIFIIENHILPFIIEIKTIIGELEHLYIKPVNQVLPLNQNRVKQLLSLNKISKLRSTSSLPRQGDSCWNPLD